MPAGDTNSAPAMPVPCATASPSCDPAARILDAALRLGERDGWDAVCLHAVAREAGISLAELGGRFRHKDDLAEAWFDRAELAMLRAADGPEWSALPPAERLRRALLAWFEAIGSRRAISVAMLRYKLQPDHLHLHAAGLVRISRTVQWLRETALLPATGWRRDAEEIALSALFVGAVGRWLLDRSADARHTRGWIGRRLAAAAWLFA